MNSFRMLSKLFDSAAVHQRADGRSIICECLRTSANAYICIVRAQDRELTLYDQRLAPALAVSNC